MHCSAEHLGKGGMYRCHFCPYCSESITDVQSHERTHTGGQPHTRAGINCSHCSPAILATEEPARKQQKRGRHRCRFCHYSSDYTNNVKKHERIHTGEKPYVCQVCFKGFTEKGALDRHSKGVHEGQRNYICAICGRAFKRNHQLQFHEKYSTSEGQHQGMRARITLPADSGTREECGAAAPKSSLGGSVVALEERPPRKHRRVEYLGKGTTHHCRFCPYWSKSTTDVLRHERTHTGERPYVCAACSKAFTQKASLERHLGAVHEGKRRRN
ncbi:zinc finger protein 596-like [Ornithodoros turicata]|uniref:zinc finger protein 596-like n=1 Tax=Ornithodoros turicata TaxID=34597 RepID=UPI003138D5A9